MTNHTPAPWVLSDARSTKVDLINTAKGDAIGEIVWVDVRNPADATLIAAAPELLDMLRKADAWIAMYHDKPGHDAASRHMTDAIRAVIATATKGTQP